MSRLALLLSAAALFLHAGCARREPARQYQLRGQIIAIGTSAVVHRTELTIKHEDIPGFMPAMTMAYFLKEGTKVDTFAPGDLLTATLVVNGSELYLQDLQKTGHAELPRGAKPIKIMDVMAPGDAVPDDALIDQAGTARRLTEWRGRALAVTFVYTRCPVPDFCPLMDRRFADVQRAILADASLRDRAHLVSVTFDPSHDTAEVIARHAQERGADPRVWSYVTGQPETIEHLTSRFGVSTILDRATADTITHNLRTAIVDAHGRLVKFYTGNEWTVAAIVADLREASGR